MIKNAFFKSWALLIKPMFMNIRFRLSRDQIPHRLPLFDQLPDLCGRDIEKRDFFEIERVAWEVDPGFLLGVVLKVRDQGLWEGWGRSVFLRSRSGHHDKVAKRKEILEFLPCLNLYKGIPSQDEEKGILRSLPKKSDGVDRVRFSKPWEFKVTGRKMRVAWGGQPHHFQSVLRLDDFFCHLMGWNGGRDEDNLLKVECLPNFLCTPEVTQMDGIEGPSE